MKFILGLTVFVIIVSCGHHKDVRPGSKGVHAVMLLVETKADGYRDAKKQADHYCDENDKKAFIVKEKAKYIGDMKEKDYLAAKKTAKILKGVGSAGVAFGGKKEKPAGGVLGVGGEVADNAIGMGYRYRMLFKCK